MATGFVMAVEMPSDFHKVNETTYTNTDDNASGQIIYIFNNTDYYDRFDKDHNYVVYNNEDGTFEPYYTTPYGLYVGIGEANETHTVLFLNKNTGDDNIYLEQLMYEFNEKNNFTRVPDRDALHDEYLKEEASIIN